MYVVICKYSWAHSSYDVVCAWVNFLSQNETAQWAVTHIELLCVLPMHVLSTMFLLTCNSLVRSNSHPILGDPRPATRFQGTEETSVHPGAGYIGTDHRLWPKRNYTFLEPQSVSTVHITSWCMFTCRQRVSRTGTAFILVSYFDRSAVTVSTWDCVLCALYVQ
jgi:hypothetical protein